MSQLVGAVKANAKLFAVVFFKSDGTYSEIPVSWLSNDRKTCLWPKTRNAALVMQKGITPDSNEDMKWEQFEVEVDSYCSTLETARKKAELGSEYSSAEDTEPKGRGKRAKFRKRRESTSTDSDRSDQTLTPPPTPNRSASKSALKAKMPEKGQVEHEIVVDCSSAFKESTPTEIKQVETENKIESALETNSSLFVDTPISTSSPETSSALNITEMPVVVVKDNISLTDLYVSIVELTKICINTQEYVKSIERKLKSNETREGEENFTLYFKNLESKMPFSNIDSLKEFDKEVSENMETRKIFTKYVKKIGGDDVKDSVNRILKCVFTNELAKSCSWYGRNDNFPLYQLQIMKLITDIIVMQHDGTLSSIQRFTSEWFRLANQRWQRDIKKKK